MDRPVIDHRGPEFAKLTLEIVEGLRMIFQAAGPVVLFPASGSGAWEAAIVNTLSPGDRILMFQTGHFSQLWCRVAEKFGVVVDYVQRNWRRGVSGAEVEERLTRDKNHELRAVAIVHNETSTGVTSNVSAIRRAIDASKHPALLLVDAISSLGSIDYRHDEWGVDVTVAGSQKGLMLPPGISFNAISERALAASQSAKLARSYWEWQEMLISNKAGFFPFTPATNLLFGLREALVMLQTEGLANAFRRHERYAQATRTAVKTWGLEIVCEEPRDCSSTLTAVLTPKGHDADTLRQIILDRFDMSLGAGLSALAGRAFRIGHLGSLNDLLLVGTLGGIEMGLQLAGIPYREGGTTAALQFLSQTSEKTRQQLLI